MNERNGGTRRSASKTRSLRGRRQQARRVVAEREHRREALRGWPSSRGPGIEPEDGAEDDLERQRLHPRVELELGGAVPAGDLALGDVGDQVAEPLHPLAVEGRQQQLALLHVRIAVEQDHRVLADERLEHAGALAGMEDVGRRRVDRLHVLGDRGDHERRREREPHREPLAVAVAKLLEVGQRALPEADRLDRGGIPGSGRQVAAHAPPRASGCHCPAARRRA